MKKDVDAHNAQEHKNAPKNSAASVDVVEVLDELVEVKHALGEVKSSQAQFSKVLMGTSHGSAQWHEKPVPYVLAPRCVVAQANETSACNRCQQACQIEAIKLDEHGPHILDACTRCGACLSTCPFGALEASWLKPISQLEALLSLYYQFEELVIATADALPSSIDANVYVVPSLDAVYKEVLTALLFAGAKIAVLPSDVELETENPSVFDEHIAFAEHVTGKPVRLITSRKEAPVKPRKDLARADFLSSISSAADSLLDARRASRQQPLYKRLVSTYMQGVRAYERDFVNTYCPASGNGTKGPKTLPPHTAILGYALTRAAAQNLPTHDFSWIAPVIDQEACTFCGACVRACPAHAFTEKKDARIGVIEALCAGCKACEKICPARAIRYNKIRAKDVLVLPLFASQYLETEEPWHFQ